MSGNARTAKAHVLLDELCSSLTASNNYMMAARRYSGRVAGAESIPPLLDSAIDQLRRSAAAYEGLKTLLTGQTANHPSAAKTDGSGAAGATEELHR